MGNKISPPTKEIRGNADHFLGRRRLNVISGPRGLSPFSPDRGAIRWESDGRKRTVLKKGESMIKSFCTAFWQEEDGQDLVEYSLLLAFIALATIGVLTTVQGSLKTLWGTVNTQLGTANTNAGT
jgi:Flp pilus assembly pilin Flp